jgi:DNA processing protein
LNRSRPPQVGRGRRQVGDRPATSCPLPDLLRQISDPPQQLWVRGALTPAPCVAIVGSRACTAYGREVATALAFGLATRGIVVVSGLARGIDAAAHRGSLDAGGPTVAVLPNGIRRVYPAGHRSLAARIENNGALLAENDSDERPARWHFPRRNRIIAGLSHAVVVVEAGVRSGARITADLALDYNREVLVVPGNIDAPRSRGCNELLRQGARPCTGVDDILDALPPAVVDLLEAPGSSVARERPTAGVEAAILRTCEEEGVVSLDDLLRATSAPLPEVLAAISRLEALGRVALRPGNQVVGATRPRRVSDGQRTSREER